MIKDETKEILFFIVIFILFFLLTKGSYFVSKKYKINKDVSIALAGLIMIALTVGVFYLAKLNKSTTDYFGIVPSTPSINKSLNQQNMTVGNSLFEVTPGKKCLGGAYMNQGDSIDAKFCQDFVKTPEGEEQLCRYQCSGYPGMYTGYPGKKFTYTNQSDNSWENAQCNTLGVISPLGIF